MNYRLREHGDMLFKYLRFSHRNNKYKVVDDRRREDTKWNIIIESPVTLQGKTRNAIIFGELAKVRTESQNFTTKADRYYSANLGKDNATVHYWFLMLDVLISKMYMKVAVLHQNECKPPDC